MQQVADNHKKISIVYFGSGPLAAKSLAFLQQQFTVEAVITKPKAPHHKGPVPVEEFCLAHKIRCLTPGNKTELSRLLESEHFASQLGIVIDYGIIISRDVIDTFRLGILNSHFSLLPEWRGADPITSALISGQTETGVSLMLINEKMDEGPLLAQAALEIEHSANGITISEDLLELSNTLLAEIVPLYVSEILQPVPQSAGISRIQTPSYSRKLAKSDGVLDWHKPAAQLEREIRAYIEWPKSRTTFGNIDVIITAAHSSPTESQPGKIEFVSETGTLQVGCTGGSLCIDRLKPAGKKEMTAAEFVRGYGARLTL